MGAAAFQPIKDWWDKRQFNDLAIADVGSAASVCGDITKKTAEGNNDHVPATQQVTYKDAPPAFGAHWNEAGLAPAPMERKLYTDDRPELESLVHNLEHGYTILWYDETIAGDDDQMLELRALADKLAGTDELPHEVHRCSRGRPRTARPSPTASTSRSPTGRWARTRRSRARWACGSTATRSPARRSTTS